MFTGIPYPWRKVALVLALLGVMWGASTSPVAAIDKGKDDPDNATNNAVVWVNGASGTLVAPNLVLTAGHCIKHPNPGSVPVVNGNWETPGKWYALTYEVQVQVGPDPVGKVQANLKGIGPWEYFKIGGPNRGQPIKNHDKITLQTSTPNRLFYLCAEYGGKTFVVSNRASAADWETFEIYAAGAGTVKTVTKIRLLTKGGFFVVDPTTGLVRANGLPRTATGRGFPDNSEFEISKGPLTPVGGEVKDGDTITLKAPTGKYVGANQGGGGYLFQVKATHYCIAGQADIVMLKLEKPVPASMATSMKVATTVPPGIKWDTAKFRMVGYGGIINSGGGKHLVRQTGDASHGKLTPTVATQMTVKGDGGAVTEPGDSGSPLIMGESVIGVNQGFNDGSISRYTTTFHRGGVRGGDGIISPDIGAWLNTLLGRR